MVPNDAIAMWLWISRHKVALEDTPVAEFPLLHTHVDNAVRAVDGAAGRDEEAGEVAPKFYRWKPYLTPAVEAAYLYVEGETVQWADFRVASDTADEAERSN